jgi:hypothetical protein
MTAPTGSPDLRVLSQTLADNGKLIEAGWIGLQTRWVPADAGPLQRAEMRQAFFAGALHLFSSVMQIMDDDREPTAADLRRMDQIEAELKAFEKELLAQLTVGGNS